MTPVTFQDCAEKYNIMREKCSTMQYKNKRKTLAKYISISLITLSLSGIFSPHVLAEGNLRLEFDNTIHTIATTPNITINGDLLIEGTIPPFITEDGMTMVSVNDFFKTLGTDVAWNGDTGEVYILHDNHFIVIEAGNHIATVDSEEVYMDDHAKLVTNFSSGNGEEVLMVPLRFLLEILDLKHEWEDSTQSISVYSGDIEEQIYPNISTLELLAALEGSDALWSASMPEVLSLNDTDDFAYEEHPIAHITDTSMVKNKDGTVTVTIETDGKISDLNTSLWNGTLSIDLPRTETDVTKQIQLVENPFISGTRSSQFSVSPMISRFVFDLDNDQVNYGVQINEARNKVNITFGYKQLYDLQLEGTSYTDTLDITGNAHLQPNIRLDKNPDRLVLTFDHVRSDIEVLNAPVDGKYITSISADMVSEDTYEIILGLKDKVQFTLEEQDGNTVRLKLTSPTYTHFIYNSGSAPQLVLDKKDIGLRADHISITDNYEKRQATLTIQGDNLTDYFGDGAMFIGDEHLRNIFLYEDTSGYHMDLNTNGVKTYTITEDAEHVYVNLLTPEVEYEKVIVLDAGHGGSAPGVPIQPTGATNYTGYTEKYLNMDIVNRVIELLEKESHIKLYLTRDEDEYVSLSDRVEMSNNLNADLFISIHNNSFLNNNRVNGTQVHTFSGSPDMDKDIAAIFQDMLVSALGTRDRGVIKDELYVLKHNNIPAILIEVAFMSNPEDGAKLATEEFRQKAAEAIYLSILKYASQYE